MANLKRTAITGLALSLSLLTACAYWPSRALLKSALGFDFGLGALTNKVMHPFGGGSAKNADQPADTNNGADKATDKDDDKDSDKDTKKPSSKGADKDADKDSDKPSGKGSDKDSAIDTDKGPEQEPSAPPPKHRRTQETDIPMTDTETGTSKDQSRGKAGKAKKTTSPAEESEGDDEKADKSDKSAKAGKSDKADKTEKSADEDDPTIGKDLAKTKRRRAPDNDSVEKMEAEVSHPKLEPKKYYDDEGAEMEESEYLDELEKKRKAKQLKELLAPAGNPEDNDPEPHLIKAKRLTKQGQFKPALTEINIALKLKPQYWEAHYQGALILQTMGGRDKEAIKEYKFLVDVRPDYLEAHINLGALLAKQGEFGPAEKEYKKALDLNFYSLSGHYNLANLYIKQERLNEALKELKICLKLQPTNAWVHNNMGVIFQKRNYLELAEEEFLKASKLEPANKSFQANLYLVRSQLRKKPVRASNSVPAETG